MDSEETSTALSCKGNCPGKKLPTQKKMKWGKSQHLKFYAIVDFEVMRSKVPEINGCCQ